MPDARSDRPAGPGCGACGGADALTRHRPGAPMPFAAGSGGRMGRLAGIAERAFPLNRLRGRMAGRGTLHGTVHRDGRRDVGHPGGLAPAEATKGAAGDA